LTICYPYVALEPIITKLSAQNWIDATKKKNLESDRMLNFYNISKVDAQLTANLLSSTIKMKDFLGLNLGDVIPSEIKSNSPIDIYINKRKKYEGRPGLSGKKRAFQILEHFEEEDMEFSDKYIENEKEKVKDMEVV
jgi:flagellar motor switch protein FliM